MIKRIIFDLDNTLLEWKEEYIFALKNVLDKLGVVYTKKELQEYDQTIVEYEKYHDMYRLDDFVKYVNKKCKSNLSLEFAELLIKEQGKCFAHDKELVETIKYLSTKYDLVVLSNWFTETQKLRLKKVGILKYFSLVSGGDEHILKPDIKAFDKVLEGYSCNECVMIGDSLNNDILPALKLGMEAIWLNKGKGEVCQTIDNIYDLKNIL